MEREVIFQDLGLIDYQQAWNYQEKLFSESVQQKITNRKNEGVTSPTLPKNHLLFCQHPHVYTLGKSGSLDHLLLDEKELAAKNATFYKINRGGDITYHGPGQLVGYPILDLDQFFTDIHQYLRYLEEAIILTMEEYGLKGERNPGYTGVWLEPETKQARKICAMGVRCSRWVTMHGFAFNVNTDLSYFKNIVPCGIEDKAVTSMEAELNQQLSLQEVAIKVKKHLSTLFEMTFLN